MKNSVALIVALASLLTAGCQHSFTVSVETYHPAQRLAELEERAKLGAKLSLSSQEQVTRAMLQDYKEANPERDAEPYPFTSYERLLAIIAAHRPWIEKAEMQFRLGLKPFLGDPEEVALKKAQTEKASQEGVIDSMKKELAARQASDTADHDLAGRKRLAAEITVREEGLVGATQEAADAKNKLQMAKALVVQSARTYRESLEKILDDTLQTLGAKRVAYLGGQLEAKVYGEEVKLVMNDFYEDFLTQIRFGATGQNVVAAVLGTSVKVPPELESIYGKSGNVQLKEVLPSEAMMSAEASKLAARSSAIVVGRDQIVRRDNFNFSATNPLLSIATRDVAGWQEGPSKVVHESSNKSDLLLIRESHGEFVPVSLKDTASTTANSTARFAVATASVVLEAAQLFAGLDLGVALTPGKDAAPGETTTVETAGAATVFTADALRSLARQRLERVRALLERAPASDAAAAAKAAWASEVRALLNTGLQLPENS